jgi:hypothetical protein
VKLTALLATVVTVAAWVLSYEALREGAEAIGISSGLSWLYPVLIDGVVATAYVASFALREAPKRMRAYVWSILLGAVLLSVAGNGLHAVLRATHLGLPLGVAVPGSAVPAVSLACVIHMHVILARAELGPAEPDPGWTRERYRSMLAEARVRGEHLSDRAAAAELGVSRQRIATLRKRLLGDVDIAGAFPLAENAE